MVQIESLSKGNQYNDLRILFPSLLDKDEDEKYIGLPLASNHITITGTMVDSAEPMMNQRKKMQESNCIQIPLN